MLKPDEGSLDPSSSTLSVQARCRRVRGTVSCLPTRDLDDHECLYERREGSMTEAAASSRGRDERPAKAVRTTVAKNATTAKAAPVATAGKTTPKAAKAAPTRRQTGVDTTEPDTVAAPAPRPARGTPPPRRGGTAPTARRCRRAATGRSTSWPRSAATCSGRSTSGAPTTTG